MNSDLMFSKASDEWSTPYDFWRELDKEFMFDLDAAASAANTKCGEWLDIASDALTREWSLVLFTN